MANNKDRQNTNWYEDPWLLACLTIINLAILVVVIIQPSISGMLYMMLLSTPGPVVNIFAYLTLLLGSAYPFVTMIAIPAGWILYFTKYPKLGIKVIWIPSMIVGVLITTFVLFSIMIELVY